MENERVSATNDIVSQMMPYLPIDVTDKLRAVCLLTLNEYRMEKEETSVALYEAQATEYYIKKFLIAKKVQGCSDNTLRYYGGQARRIFETINKPLQEIRSDDILVYFARRELESSVSKVTLNNERRVLLSFFNYLVEEAVINRSPMMSIKEIKAPKRKKPSFSDMEVEQLRNACKNEKEKCIVEVLLSTGCRVSELCSIKKSDIKDAKINIIGKGDKERVVYLNAKALLAISAYIEKRNDKNEYLFPLGKQLSDLTKVKKKKHCVFDWTDADFIEPKGHADKGGIEAFCRSLGKRANVSDCHPHRFRRTCATMALKRGMPLVQVSKMLGHEQLQTTQIYLDISEDEIEQMHRKYVI